MGFKVFSVSFLLNRWGRALLLPQLYLAEVLETEIFYTSYFLTGAVCLLGFMALLIRIVIRPAYTSQLICYGLGLYFLLIIGIEGVTHITERTFGH